MTTYRAAVKYERDATDAEKIAALKAGIINCALELAELGVPFDEVEDACEAAVSAVEWHL